MATMLNNATTASDRAWQLRAKGPLLCTSVAKFSGGIWSGQDPPSKVFPMFLLQFIIMNVVSQSLHFLFRPLKQPKVVCYFLVGLIMSPTVMGRWKFFNTTLIRPEEIVLVRTVGYLGIMYFLFLLAVKTDVGVFRRTYRQASVVGFMSVLAAFFIVLASTYVFNLPGVTKSYFRILFAAGLSMTRFPNVAYTFNELNIMTSELGQLAVSCSMISEVIAWFWLVAGQFLRFPVHQGLNVLYMVATMIVLYLATLPGIQYIVRRSPDGQSVKESYILWILIGSMVVGFVSDMVGSMQLGFLVYGLLIPNGPPLGTTLAEKAEVIVAELLFPIYYVAVGYNLNFSMINLKVTGELLLVVVVATLSKLVAAASSAYFLGNLRFHHSILLGLMLIIKGPFDLYLYSRWTSSNEIDKPAFTAIAISELIVTAIVTPLIDTFYNPHVRLSSSAGKNARSFITTPRNAELQLVCCVHSEDDVPGVISLVDALALERESPIRAYVLHLNEIIGHATPDIVPYKRQMRRVKSNGSTYIMRAFDNYSMGSQGMVSVRPYSVIAEPKSMHEYICRLALQQHIPLIVIPFRANQGVNAAELAAIRIVNSNVQAYSPSTVGLLVSRGVPWLTQSADSLMSVAVVFITGNDDREALAIGIRMAGKPNVKVTLIRINVPCWESVSIEEKAEKKLDDLIVYQFVAERERNDRIGYHEIAAENMEQVMQWLKGLECGYDLIIMGRKRRKTNLLDEDVLLDWSDYPELGVLGNMIMSAEHFSSVSMLVMQHYGDVNIKVREEPKEDEGKHLLIKPT